MKKISDMTESRRLNPLMSKVGQTVDSLIVKIKKSMKTESKNVDVNVIGIKKHFNIIVSPSIDSTNELDGFITIINDMTDQSDYISSLKHNLDYRTSIDSLIFEDFKKRADNIENLTNELDKESASKILYELNYVKETIDFADIFRSIGTSEPEWQNFGELIQKAITSENIPIHSLDKTLNNIRILADIGFYDVFKHLIHNSLNSIKPATDIGIGFRIDNGKLTLIYSDNGLGIPYSLKKDALTGLIDGFGLGMLLIGNVLTESDFEFNEVGIPDEGLTVEITIPHNRYSIDWNN